MYTMKTMATIRRPAITPPKTPPRAVPSFSLIAAVTEQWFHLESSCNRTMVSFREQLYQNKGFS